MQIDGTITGKNDVSASSEGSLTTTNEIESTEGKVIFTATGDIETIGDITAKEDISIVSEEKITIASGAVSSEAAVQLESKSDMQIDGTITGKNDVSAISEGSLTATDEIESTEGKAILTAKGDITTSGDITAKENISITSDEKITIVDGVISSEAEVRLESKNDMQIDGTITGKNDVSAISEGNLTATDEIESTEGKVIFTAKGDIETSGDITAKEDISIVSDEKLTIASGAISSEAAVQLESKNDMQIDGTITGRNEVSAASGGNLTTTGEIESSEGKAIFTAKENITTGGGITAKDNVEIDSEGEVIIDGKISSNAQVLLDSKDDMTINDTISSVYDILSNVETGTMIINDAVKSSLGNIRLNILHNNLFINNKVISQNGTVFVNAYGNISDDPLSATAGIYANEVDLTSVKGNVGSKLNNMRIENANSSPIIASVSALNGEIYVDGFSEGLMIKKFASDQDTLIIAGSDIYGYAFAGEREPNLSAKNIFIESTNGSIGTEDSRITVAPITVDPLSGIGRVNLSAYSGIYVNQYEQFFYSDYVRNLGYGTASLVVPDNDAYITELLISPSSSMKINFLNSKYKRNIEIAAYDIKKIVIHPESVLYPQENQALLGYDVLFNFKQNIKNEIEEILSDTPAIISLNAK
jgi:hypothetical protein